MSVDKNQFMIKRSSSSTAEDNELRLRVLVLVKGLISDTSRLGTQ